MNNFQIRWYDEDKKQDWIDRIFKELGHYYNKFIEDIAEIPFYYTERALVGHLAIAAYNCG